MITIIVLLILASVSISMLSGENGILTKATTAKEKTDIGKEKEIVNLSAMGAYIDTPDVGILKNNLKRELDANIGEGKYLLEGDGPFKVTYNDSQRTYYVDNNGNISEYEYEDLPIMENGIDFWNRMEDYRESILSVTVLDNINIPENSYKVFDVSKNQDESVKAWMIENPENIEMYDLYIGGNEGVEIESCVHMFAFYSNCISIDISNLYTENATNFKGMFTWDTKLQNINLSNIDTSCATDTSYMFNKCTSLTQLDVSNFNTNNVTNMAAMFYQCAFTEINLSNFNTSKVTAMNEMFRQCYHIEELDLSSFDTSSLQRTDSMFYGCGSKLKKIYVSDKWSNNKVTLSNDMFSGCQGLSGKISYDSTKLDITYANYDTGYFTYKDAE